MAITDTEEVNLSELAPYDQWRQCPKCRRRFKLTPGDRFDVMDDPIEDAFMVTECPNCRSTISITLTPEEVNACTESVVMLPYREYAALVESARRAERIDTILDRWDVLMKFMDYTGDTVERAYDGIAEIADRLAQQRPRSDPDEIHYREHRQERAPRRLPDHDEREARPRRQRRERDDRPQSLRPDIIGGDNFTRGNVDHDREEALMQGRVTLDGGSAPRRGSMLADDDGDDEA